jgi:hypothetical protein
MIAWLATLALAGKVAEGDISTDRGHPTTVWVRPGAVVYDPNRLDSKCEWVPAAVQNAPANLRARAFLVRRDCGIAYVFLDLPHSGEYARVRLDDVSLEPPRGNPWDDRSPVGVAYARTGGDEPLAGWPVDDARATAPLLLVNGEEVEVLDAQAQVVRTVEGREVMLPRNRFVDDDPLRYGSDPQRARAVLDRLLAGRVRRGPIGWLPSADTLVEGGAKDVAYAFVLRDRDHGDLVASPDWVDPVGLVIRHACDQRSRPEEPCGSYYLDFSPMGSWWPDEPSVSLLVVGDGVEVVNGERLARLKVMARSPWTERRLISIGWDP